MSCAVKNIPSTHFQTLKIDKYSKHAKKCFESLVRIGKTTKNTHQIVGKKPPLTRLRPIGIKGTGKTAIKPGFCTAIFCISKVFWLNFAVMQTPIP